jgi:hypothetical protein
LFTKVFEQTFLTRYEHSNFAIEEKKEEKRKRNVSLKAILLKCIV